MGSDVYFKSITHPLPLTHHGPTCIDQHFFSHASPIHVVIVSQAAIKFWRDTWEKTPLLCKATKERKAFFSGLFALDQLLGEARRKVGLVCEWNYQET